MVRQRGCAMRMTVIGVFLLTGSAALSQTPGTTRGSSVAAWESTQVVARPGNFFVQAQPAQAKFSPQGTLRLGNQLSVDPQVRLQGPGTVLALNDPSVRTPLAQLAGPRAIPIPTQWPQAKMEAIPTRWPSLKVVPIGGAGVAMPAVSAGGSVGPSSASK